MTDNLRLLDLVEEALDSGRAAEEVCAEFPELIPELRRRLQRCQIVQDELGALFPSETVAAQAIDRESDDSARSLPAIPGYEAHSILGRGGMGVVYKARHLSLKRFVAIKMLLSGIHASASERARLKREAEALAKLTNPNIVHVYDVGELAGRPYFTMEFVEGGNLAEQLAGVPQPAGDATAVLISLAGAVEAAHECGILHRDLKPANVLLTPDGVPKISDFGLARQVEDADLITLTGARLGTPSYMAPEQASSRWGEVGRTSDVYALGAILYEMLTGRPPFRGESPADTERQLLHEEVVPPSRLNTRVPRDLETICLKCLQKDQDRRYTSAAALAEDLGRFQNSEPILARRVGPLERLLKWVRRRPAAATAVATAAILALVLAAGGTWIVSKRATSRTAIANDLANAIDFQRRSKWAEASALLDRAKVLLDEFGQPDLRSQYDIARRDSDLVAALEQPKDWSDLAKIENVDLGYIGALRRAQIGGPESPPETVASRIRNSNVKPAIIDGLDYWLCFAKRDRPWVLEVLRAADHDPTGWRDHVRDPAVWNNPGALAEAADTAPIAAQPSSFLLSMGSQLAGSSHALAIPFLKRIQEAHPDDFWIDLTLGNELDNLHDRAGGIRYMQAAEALHPNSTIVRNQIGQALLDSGQFVDALAQFRESFRLNPESGMAKENFAALLALTGHDAEAISRFQELIQTDPANPRMALFYSRLAKSLANVGREQDAIAAYRKSVNLSPNTENMPALVNLLIRLGRWDQVESVWRDAIKVDPGNHDSWDGYAEYCLFLGHTDEYRKLRGLLLDRFGDERSIFTCDRAGRACLLLGDDSQEIARAAAMADRAFSASDPNVAGLHAYFTVGKGLADYRRGNFAAALTSVEGDGAGVLKPMPQLIAAMAHYRLGDQQAARRKLAESVLAFDWRRENATTHEAWIYHVLRREAEQLILPNFAALLDGSAQARDNDERMALLGACAFDDLRGRSAQLWIDALAAAPQLARDHLVDVAHAEASAGSGQGKDAGKFTDEDRTRWRESAIDLLSRRVDDLAKILDSANPQTAAVQNDLTALQQSPELAGLRDPDSLARLPKPEQDKCTAFWARVRLVFERSIKSK